MIVSSCEKYEPTYSYLTIIHDYSQQYLWDEVHVTIHYSKHVNAVQRVAPLLYVHGVNVSEILSQNVYVSLTTIASRINTVYSSILTILNGVVIPTRIFLFVSRTPHLLDDGVVTLPNTLLCLSALNLLTVVFTDNLGPHRKLLPLLSRYYHDTNALIVTVDDDLPYVSDSSLLYQLVHSLVTVAEERAVVALRVRRIGLCTNTSLPVHHTKYGMWPLSQAVG